MAKSNTHVKRRALGWRNTIPGRNFQNPKWKVYEKAIVNALKDLLFVSNQVPQYFSWKILFNPLRITLKSYLKQDNIAPHPRHNIILFELDFNVNFPLYIHLLQFLSTFPKKSRISKKHFQWYCNISPYREFVQFTKVHVLNILN